MSAPAATPQRLDELEALRGAFVELLTAERRLRGREGRDPSALSMAQWRLLARLLDEDGCAAGRLAEAADVSAATASGLLDTLESRGMVVRERSPEDRRSVRVRLTDPGRAAVLERRESFRELWAEAMDGLSDEDLAAGRAVLERIPGLFARVMERKAAAPPPGASS